jgi:hypothetical protein
LLLQHDFFPVLVPQAFFSSVLHSFLASFLASTDTSSALTASTATGATACTDAAGAGAAGAFWDGLCAYAAAKPKTMNADNATNFFILFGI